MICVEIPLRTLHDQAASLEGTAASEAGMHFAAGALAVLNWLAQKDAPNPTVLLMRLEERRVH